MNKIHFVDLYAQYISIKEDIDRAISNVIRETAFIKGKYVDIFEKNFARLYGAKHCIGVGNGTDAIYIILKQLGIKEGDEVITVSNSWISTSETISQTGAKPIFVDIDPGQYTIDVSKIEEKITSRTKAIIPVHIYGQPAELKEIDSLCKKYGLNLIEDCAQAHFAEYDGKKVGLFGIASSFSFFPGKNLGAYGDAGCILTNDDELADKMRRFANHGGKPHHYIEGINSRLDGLQAAILDAKLPYILQWTEKRIEIAKKYFERLNKVDSIILPRITPHTKHVFHLLVIRCDNRETLQKQLDKNGIPTAIHYPVALPFLPAYDYLNHKPEDFPIAFESQNKILSLPIYPELSDEQLIHITDCITNFYK